MNKNVRLAVLVAVLLVGGAAYLPFSKKDGSAMPVANTALAANFDMLSKNGNSSCSTSFQQSIDSMPDTARLQGSCCSPMNLHRYSEQVTGLQKYKDITEIPSDPFTGEQVTEVWNFSDGCGGPGGHVSH